MMSDLARDASRVLTGSLSWIVKWPCWSVVETWMQQVVVVAATFEWPVTDDSWQTNLAVCQMGHFWISLKGFLQSERNTADFTFLAVEGGYRADPQCR